MPRHPKLIDISNTHGLSSTFPLIGEGKFRKVGCVLELKQQPRKKKRREGGFLHHFISMLEDEAKTNNTTVTLTSVEYQHQSLERVFLKGNFQRLYVSTCQLLSSTLG